MRHTILQSRHCRTIQPVITKQEEWHPGQKAVKPEGHVSNTQPHASRVYDEEWELRAGHIVRAH